VVRDYLFLRETQVAKYFNRTLVGLGHRRALLRAPRPRGPPVLPAAGFHARLLRVPPGRSVFHVNVALFMTTRIAFMAYLSSLTGMRRLAFAPSEWLAAACPGLQGLRTGIRVWRRERWRGRRLNALSVHPQPHRKEAAAKAVKTKREREEL
jgi:hypothetical protein